MAYLLEMNIYPIDLFWVRQVGQFLCTRTPLTVSMCSRYHETVSDVLSAVRRMEESLKRLKHARRPVPAAPAGPRAGSMSDDDKIRLQLALDVAHLGEQVTHEPPPLPAPPGWNSGPAATGRFS